MHHLIAILILAIGSADQTKIDRYPRSDLLLELSELLKPDFAKEFRILDARPKSDYEASHLPNAVWVDHDAWSKTFAKSQDARKWQPLIGWLGINTDTRVVIYDDQSTNRAARIWWLLRYWGIRDVRLLNGGWKGWAAAHGPTTQDVPKIETTELTLTGHSERLATKDLLMKSLQKHEGRPVQIIDARSEAEYCGEGDTAKRNGAIPGAIHKEWTEVIDKKTQRFKSPQELSKIFQEAGIKLDRPSVTYCQSGGRAAVMAFALELMGVKSVRNYYRSWSEWGNAEDTPVEKPRGKVKLTMHRSAAGMPNEMGWYEATSTKGKFTVLLPGTFNDFTTSSPAKDGEIVELHTVGMITEKKAKFSAMAGTGTSKHRKQGGIEEFVKSYEKMGRMGNKKAVELDGIPGMEFTVRDGDNAARFRVYLKDRTIYQLIVEYPTELEKELKPDIDRFMNSLKIPKE